MKNIIKSLFFCFFIFTGLGLSAQSWVNYPFGAADFSTLTVDNDTLSPTIKNQVTYLTGSDTLIANTIIMGTNISSKLKAGALLYLRLKSGVVARSVTPNSTKFTGVAVSGVASKTKLIQFVYDGSKFVYVSSFQID